MGASQLSIARERVEVGARSHPGDAERLGDLGHLHRGVPLEHLENGNATLFG